MVLEQVLTIIFAVGIGAAVIIYAARPRHRGAPLSVAASTLDSFSQVGVTHSEPTPQAAAVETVPEEVRAPAEVSPVVTEAAAAGQVEVAPAATPTAAPSPAVPVQVAETVEPAPHAARGARRAQRKRSTTTKSRARSSRTKKSQTRSE